jgi:hypothetical protein
MICVEMQNIDDIIKISHQSMTGGLQSLSRPDVSLMQQLTDEQKQMLIKMGVLPAEPSAPVATAAPTDSSDTIQSSENK